MHALLYLPQDHSILVIAGTYKAFQFSASEATSSVHEKATATRSLFLDRKQTYTLGEVRYLTNNPNVTNDITDEFYTAVLNLPVRFSGLTAQDKQQYFDFFDKWGTVSVAGQRFEPINTNNLECLQS